MNTITCKGSWKQQLIQAKQHLIAERLTPETPADFVPEWIQKLLASTQPTEAYTVPTEGAGASDEVIPF